MKLEIYKIIQKTIRKITIKNFVFITLYIILLTLYISYSSNKLSKWENENKNWREINIKNSPKVCITATGTKYHRCYHYSGRNKPISLFEAVEKKYEPCLTCTPPKILLINTKPLRPNFFISYWTVITIFFSFFYYLIFFKFRSL